MMRLEFQDDSGIMLPVRVLRDQAAQDTETQIVQLNAVALPTSDPAATPVGAPDPLTDVTATESPIKVQGRTVSEVSVSFTRNAGDTKWGGTRIWFRGYKGNTDAILVTEGQDSPITFLCEATGETVTVIAQAISTDGTPVPLDSCPNTTVALDGVTSAPPAPSIAQTLLGVPLGYQFAFNQVNVGSTEDVIDSYRIYRYTSNTPGSATLQRTFRHDPTSLGAIVVQDNVGGGLTYYYWVTAVNTIGLESAKTAAQSGAVISGTVPTTSQVPINTVGTFTGANPLSQSGTTTTINVASFTMQWGFGTVSYNSGSVNPGGYGTYYIYADDPNYQGGAVAFSASASKLTLFQSETRIYVGSITTSAGGIVSSDPGGGGCPLSGAPVKLFGKKEWWRMRVIPCEDFITLVTSTGRRGTFSRDDRRYCRRGLLALSEWRVGDWALTDDGEERVIAVRERHMPGATVDSWEAVDGHIYSAWGFIGHNNKAYIP